MSAPEPRLHRRRPIDLLERIAFGAIWLAIAIAISLGAAGVVAALDHRPGSGARPELTWAADGTVTPALDTAEADLRSASQAVDELGVEGRGALAALAARDFDLLERTIARGSALIATASNRSREVEQRLARLEGFGPGADLRLSPETQARYLRLTRAAEATAGLDSSWVRLTQGGLAAAQLAQLLGQHDEAIEAGRAGKFDTALARIDDAGAALAEATTMRNQLAEARTDVGTADEWLRRNRNYDTALRALYEATKASPNRVTDQLRKALRDEKAARDELPRNTNALSVIMADIARGGLNQAVIAIEDARGRLAEALVPEGAAGS
jgi:hypothetical protein